MSISRARLPPPVPALFLLFCVCCGSSSSESGRFSLEMLGSVPQPPSLHTSRNSLFSNEYRSPYLNILCNPTILDMGEEARAKFLQKLNALYAKKPNNTYLVSKYGNLEFKREKTSPLDYINRLQRLTTLNDHQVQRTAADQRLLKNCCIENDPTSNQLKLCKPGTSLAYVPLEDLYDVLLGLVLNVGAAKLEHFFRIHLQLNHAGRNCMQRFIRTRYCNISKDCVGNHQ
jgi:hypothetical protein